MAKATMLNGSIGGSKTNSLMGEYSLLLGEAVFRQRARVAEQTAQIETDLASKVKSEFISNMSHELRTPLNTIIGFSKLLREHRSRALTNEEIIEYAHLINDAAGHLLSVVNDILDISKMQNGRFTLDAQKINLKSVLNDAIANYQDSASQNGVKLHTRLDPDLPMVRGDKTKLSQIFKNLIDNAIKFTRDGGSVALDALRTNSGGSLVYIRDTGVGMSDDEIEVALTPFGQVDATRARWREGTGLGLSIAKALVELHGGRLEITSAKSMGTEVSVMLPSPALVSLAQGHEPILASSPASALPASEHDEPGTMTSADITVMPAPAPDMTTRPDVMTRNAQ